MVSIDVRVGEHIEQALRRFNREVLKAGVLQEVQKRQYYMPPSAIRKEAKKEKARKIASQRRRSRGGRKGR